MQRLAAVVFQHRRLLQLRWAFAVYASLPRLFRLGAAASPGRVAAMFVIYLLYSLLQPAGIWMSKLLVDAVRSNQTTMALLVAGAYVALRLIGNAQGFVYEIVVAGFRDRALYHLHLRLMQKATALPDLSLFDTASFYDRLQQAREAVPRLYLLVNGTVTLSSIILVFLALLGILARLNPLASLVVFLTAIPTYFAQLRITRGAWHVYQGHVPDSRRLEYYSQVLTGESTAKEVRLFDQVRHKFSRRPAGWGCRIAGSVVGGAGRVESDERSGARGGAGGVGSGGGGGAAGLATGASPGDA